MKTNPQDIYNRIDEWVRTLNHSGQGYLMYHEEIDDLKRRVYSLVQQESEHRDYTITHHVFLSDRKEE